MAAEFDATSPLAKQLQNAVQHKLMELGWSSGGLDDSALAEYIILMVAGGKTAPEVAQELSNDFVAEGAGAPEFAQWLFQQVEALNRQGNQNIQPASQTPAESSGDNTAPEKAEGTDMEVDNSGAMDSEGGSIPTGPKSMRSRDKRFLGQMNKALDRSGDNKVLHRIKGAAGGAGRINSHGREQPKSASSSIPPKGPRATMHRLANNAPSPGQQNMMNGMGGAFANPLASMTPHQQMQLMAMYEQQAKMMAQIFNVAPPQQGGGMQGHGPGIRNPQSGKSLFDRVNKAPNRESFQPDAGQAQHGTGDAELLDPGSSMEVEPGSQNKPNPDHDTTMCRFNLTCNNPDCYFVHQSPAAPPGTPVDMSDVCSFGAACKNRKCTGKHPSPAKLGPARSEQECRFYPNCTNIACPFKHPTMPPCRNGADCTKPNCKFFHTKVECKFDPCLNAACPYKHQAGQKRGSYNDKVWTNQDGAGKEHVSDRKFIDDQGGDEELVVPSKVEETAQAEGIVT